MPKGSRGTQFGGKIDYVQTLTNSLTETVVIRQKEGSALNLATS